MRRMITFGAIATAAAVLLMGCNQAANNPPSGNPTTAPVTSPPTEEIGANPTAVIDDGRHPVYLKTVDLAKRTITFDLIEFLTGEQAKKRFQQDHPGEEGPDNDYYIVNQNPKLRTVPVADSVLVKVLPQDGTIDPIEVPLSEIKGPFDYRPFWLTVVGGQITKIEEQFIP